MLQVRRSSTDSFGRLRRMKIVIDGGEFGGLHIGETLLADVPPGRRNVEARMDWCSSPVLAVDVSTTGTTRIEVEYPYWHGIKHLFYKRHEAIRIREANARNT